MYGKILNTMTDFKFDSPILQNVYNNLVGQMREPTTKDLKDSPAHLPVDWKKVIGEKIELAKAPDYMEEISATNLPREELVEIFTKLEEIYPDQNKSHTRYYICPGQPVIIIEKLNPIEDGKFELKERKIQFFGNEHYQHQVERINEMLEL